MWAGRFMICSHDGQGSTPLCTVISLCPLRQSLYTVIVSHAILWLLKAGWAFPYMHTTEGSEEMSKEMSKGRVGHTQGVTATIAKWKINTTLLLLLSLWKHVQYYCGNINTVLAKKGRIGAHLHQGGKGCPLHWQSIDGIPSAQPAKD